MLNKKEKVQRGRTWENDRMSIFSTNRWQYIKYREGKPGEHYIHIPYVSYYGDKYEIDEFEQGNFKQEEALCGTSIAGSFAIGIGAALLIHLNVHHQKVKLFFVIYKPTYKTQKEETNNG